MLLMGTSLRTEVNFFDFLFILVDVIFMVYFQVWLFNYYKKYKGMHTVDIPLFRDRELIAWTFSFQNANHLMLPLIFVFNLIEMTKIGLLFLFQTSTLVFGIATLLFNLIVIVVIWIAYFETKQFYS